MKQFKTESKRILDLMINSIYTNKEIFLRELISNASDAIDKLKFISLTDNSIAQDFKISISLDKENKIITIEDNGIGMTDKDLEKNLGTIAESGTLAFKKENSDKTENELIGQFGVGFYSAFMVADKIVVCSKAHGSDLAYKWESNGVEGYTIEQAQKQKTGTKIDIYLKADTDDYKYSEFLDEYKIASLIKQYSDYIRYPIEMMMPTTKLKEGSSPEKPEYEQVFEKQILNSMIPLWKKPKAQVTTENLNEFYQNEFHDYQAPLKSVYAKIEGSVTYDTLLFVPQKVPYDYFSKDYKKGVKLYCNGVMIMEKCEELIPDYFGFVKGIVDSSDLSLNISREILQQDRQVKAIATSLEKKILSELKKMMEDDKASYQKLFAEFGLSIKFGVYAGFGMNKDKLKDLLMFYSSKKQQLITLAEYVKDMQDNQEFIYYASGESYEKIDALPNIEKLKNKGYEVLYFKDGVDEFVAKILLDFEGKKFKSVSEQDFSVDTEDEKKELEIKEKENKQLLDDLNQILKDKVKQVKLTSNFKDYPVALSASGDVSIEMEKVFNSMPNQGQKVKAEKVLEISLEHGILDRLKNASEDKEKLKKYATVLYEQARILAGLDIENPTEFVKAFSDII